MAIPVRSKQVRSLIDQNTSQIEKITQQLWISEDLYCWAGGRNKKKKNKLHKSLWVPSSEY